MQTNIPYSRRGRKKGFSQYSLNRVDNEFFVLDDGKEYTGTFDILRVNDENERECGSCRAPPAAEKLLTSLGNRVHQILLIKL